MSTKLTADTTGYRRYEVRVSCDGDDFYVVKGLEQTLQLVQTRRFASVPSSCVVYYVQLLANADDAQPNGARTNDTKVRALAWCVLGRVNLRDRSKAPRCREKFVRML